MNPPNWESHTAGLTSHDTVWSSRIQWGAILAGSMAGFGIVLLMTLLGAALGITAGTVAGHETDNATTEDAGRAAMAFGIGSGIWMLLTAVATGLVAGWVLNNTSRRDRAYSPVIFGGLSWAVGACTMLFLASPTLGGAISGLGSGAGGVAGGAANAAAQRPDLLERIPGERSATNQPSQNRNEADRNGKKPAMSDQDKAAAADAAKKAATTATIATWVMLVSHLIALLATIFAAGYHRSARVRPITELRPRPVPAP